MVGSMLNTLKSVRKDVRSSCHLLHDLAFYKFRKEALRDDLTRKCSVFPIFKGG